MLCGFVLMCWFSIKKKRTRCCFNVGICCFAFDEYGDGGEEVASYVILEFCLLCCYGIIQVTMFEFFYDLFHCFEEMIYVFVRDLDLWWRCKVIVKLSFFVGFFIMILFLEGTCKACKLEGEFKILLKLVMSTTNSWRNTKKLFVSKRVLGFGDWCVCFVCVYVHSN